ncbi:MAG: spore germination protein GerW family protein [Chloroflexota bacterium]
MSEKLNRLIVESVPNQAKFNDLIGQLFEVTKPTAVYSEPVSSGDYTVITASEVAVGLGAGFGGGGGVSEKENGQNDAGHGGGGGGGGSALSRPVAAIIIGPDGVRVEPIVDPTKIAITLFTALGAMGMALRKMKSQ